METMEIVKTQSFVIDQLEECQKRLLNIEVAILEINKNTQFDYTTSSRLASLIDALESRIAAISDNVYQKL